MNFQLTWLRRLDAHLDMRLMVQQTMARLLFIQSCDKISNGDVCRVVGPEGLRFLGGGLGMLVLCQWRGHLLP